MGSKKLKSFNIMSRLELLCSIDIKAESLEDAVNQGKLLKEGDFVNFNGDFVDGSLKIVSVYDNEDSSLL